MDLTSKNMYDTLKDEIWKELGPLDPDWFDVLTSQTFPNEGNDSDVDELSANQERNFKTTFDTAAVESQLFSTPRDFRHNRVVSPKAEDDQSFTHEQENEALAWTTTQSPYLFGMSKGCVPGAKYEVTLPQSEESFDLLQTPIRSPVSYAKQISESLGAQIHPDISWTSSLNTPTAVPSTLILSKTDGSPCPVSVSADKNVVTVRKLFPSLSNACRTVAPLPKNTDVPALQQGPVSPVADQNPEPHDSLQSSLNQSEGVWRQKLPDAIEDGEIRSTVASVLDGAENVLSMFFSNSSSTLRKVKPERSKRKHVILKKEEDFSTTDISATNNGASTEQKVDDQDPGKCSFSPVEKTVLSGNSQWSPLSLSEIPLCTVDTLCHDDTPSTHAENKSLTKNMLSDLARPLLTNTHSGLPKKNRKFIYSVQTLKTQGEEMQSQKMDLSPRTLHSGGLTSVQPKVQDLDMSQLCKDFAEDFTQNHFSPSACLSAMKQAKQKTKQANLHQGCEGFINRGNPPAINLNVSCNGATVSDSGFQSAIANNSQNQYGFKDDTHRNAPISSTNKEPGNTHLEDTLEETDASLCGAIKEELDSGTENGWHKESASTQCPWSGEQTSLLNCHINASLPEKSMDSLPSICSAGFKTASDEGMDTANLERGFFQENEAEKTNIGHDTKGAVGVSHGSVTSTTSKSIPQLSPSEVCGNVNCQLTASQKADVTELCTLLEESNSQFEFTQFEAAKLKPHCEHDATSLQTVGKGLDPDFLTGIDFDDSFTSDAEKQTVTIVMPDKLTDSKSNYRASKITCSSLTASNAVRENSSTADGFSSESSRNMSTEPKTQAKAENSGINKLGIKNPSTLGLGFKTAGGNVLRVSKQCLRKAKDLFADIEEHLNDRKSLDRQRSEIDAQSMQGQTTGITDEDTTKGFKSSKMDTGQSGFQMASGKGISVSAKALKEAKAFFEDCVLESNKDMSVKHKRSTEPLTDPVIQKENNLQFKHVQKIKHNFSGEPVRNLKDTHYGSNINVEIDSPGIKNTSALTNVDSPQEYKSLTANASYAFPHTTSKGGSSVCGFSTASGKKVSVSAEAMKKAESLLNESHALGETEGDAFKTDYLHEFVQSKNAGFQTASGKGVVISSTALKKARSLLSKSEVEVDHVSVKPYSKMPVTGPPLSNCGFVTASGKPAAPSAETLHKAKALFSDIDIKMPLVSDIRNDGNTAFGEFSSSDGFCTASGKKVCVSDDAVRKAKSLLGESIEFEETNKNHCKDALPTQNGGFQTASGKRVAVSSAALKTANTLLSEAEGVGHKIGVKPTHFQKSFSCPAPKTSGFNGSSDQPGALSSEALQKAEGFFMDTSAVSKSKKTDRYDGAQNITHCGFTTAGGAKVSVSEKGLMKAKNFMKEFDDGDCHHSNSYSTSPHDIHKPDPPKLRDVKNSCLKLITVSDNDIERDVDQTILNQGPKLSFLTFQSCNLSGCTETQQKLLAQEAFDCTKALLEDEGIADQNLSVTLGNVPHQAHHSKSDRISVEEQQGRRKRSVEDTDMTGQPPLKRRLLEEFDRTVNGPRRSALLPERSCPSGVMNDRRVFKYSDSLHPNIIKPHSHGKHYVETRLQKTTPIQHTTSGDSRPARSKMPAFVPPFYKNAKTPTLKNTALSDNKRKPAFVPPFKKQESSSKAQEQDLHRLPLIAPPKSNIYVPPVKKAQSTKPVIYSESKDDIQTVVFSGSTNANQVTNPHDPVGCKAEDLLGIEDTVSRDQEIQNLENVELARDMQDMRIRKKKRQTIRPVPGSLFLTKTSGVSRIPLKAAVNGKPARHTQDQLYEYGVQQHVSEITSETAENFRFHLQQFFKQEAFVDGGGVHLADGGWLVSSNDGTAGKEDFYRALCDTPGVDPKLISEQWVYNHYRWIVWKQASMERSFPETMGSLCLTPEQVLLQLKYRYDVEVDHSRRPALRKIMERDDTAAKTLVLCVCGVVSRGQSPNRRSCSDTKTPQGMDAKRSHVENPSAVIWLTDGWYAIKAQVDEPLTAMLHKGRLAIGGKLIVHGAQLVGSQDACSPLEAPESLMLKICANSSRPARWDTKLGFYKDPRPFLLPVSCLYSNGGPVGCVDIIILRSYPIQWMERKSDGGVVFRSVRAEEKEARRYDNHKQKAMEIIFAKIQAEFEREVKDNKSQHRRRTISNQDIASLQDGEELFEAVGDDPAYLEAHLSEQQLETLRIYRRSLMEKKQAEMQDRYRRAVEAEDNEGICPKRDVTPVWRLCVADSMDHPGSVYQLNLWRPSSDLQSLLKEGCRYKVFNLSTSDGKKRSGIEMIQLTGTTKTQFQDLQTSQEWLSARFQPRVSTSFVDLHNTEYQPLCGEVDVTGCVISVIDEQGSSPAFYLVDGNLNFVKVRCFNSFSQSGLEDLVKPRVLLALSNLQLRGQSTTPTFVVYAGDLTIFSTNPKELHLQESLSQLRNLIQGQLNFYLTAEEKLSHLIQSYGLSSVTSAALQTHSPASITERRPDTKANPVKILGSFTPVSRKLVTATSSTEKDPKSLKRRRALDYLSHLPSPPILSHLSSAVASPCLKKTFNPPRRSGTPSTLKTVQTPACKPVCSQVEDEWVNDEELAMIDTQALRVGNIDT